MTEPNWKLEDDLQTVTVTFPTNPPMVLKLNAAGVDAILQGLGGLRSAMQPTVAPDFAAGQQFLAVPHPSWLTEADALQGNAVLHLRDPRFGWLHYMIAREEARKLAVNLAIHGDTPVPLPILDKPN